ncbi:hypothetical protein NPIL_149141, partial [Nephila pilipes]
DHQLFSFPLSSSSQESDNW